MTCASSNGEVPGRAGMLRDHLQQLREKVTEAGTLSGGGTFHWVDSLLVKVGVCVLMY